MDPKCKVSCSMLCRGSTNDDINVVQYDDNVEIEVEFEVFFQYSDWDPLLVSNIKKSYLQPRIYLSLNVMIRQCMIRNALVSTIEKSVGKIEYDLHTQNMIDDITPQVASVVCDFLENPSNLNVRGLTLAIKITRTDLVDNELRECEIGSLTE